MMDNLPDNAYTERSILEVQEKIRIKVAPSTRMVTEKYPIFHLYVLSQRTKLLEKNMKIYLNTQAFKMIRIS